MSPRKRSAYRLALVAICLCVFVPPSVGQECPELVGSLVVNISAIAVSGDFAYLGSGGFLLIVDVADPSNPHPVGSVWITSLDIVHVAVSGGYAYVTWNGCYNEVAYGGVQVVDVSDPAHPIDVGPLPVSYASTAVAISGDYAYVPSGGFTCNLAGIFFNEGLSVVDVGEPASAFVVGASDGPFMGIPNDVAISGSYVYVSDTAYSGPVSSYGLRVVDVGTPAVPVETSLTATPGDARSIAVSGDFVYVADSPDGLRVFDVSEPATPEEVAFFETPGEASDVAVSRGFAYVADGGWGLRVIDVSTPSAPIEVGFSYGGVAVAVSDGYVYSVRTNEWDQGQLFIFRECAMFFDGFESGDTSAWSETVP